MTCKVSSSFVDVLASLRAVIASSYKLAPFAVILIVAIVAGIVGLSIWSSKMMMGVVLILVWLVSLLVYLRTQDFGEAALALVAGLLTVYTVEWTPLRFIAFCAAWVGFAATALLISSLRLAASTEKIYMDGASLTASDPSLIKGQYETLRIIGEKTQYGQFGPIQRAEIIRFFCFRRVPVGLMRQLLQATETVSLASRIDPIRIAGLFADFTKLHSQDPASSMALVDVMDAMLKRSPVSPDEYIAAFENTRHYVLGQSMPIPKYFERLERALNSGISPQSIDAWFEKHYGSV